MPRLDRTKRLMRRVWKTRSKYPVLRVPLVTRYEGGWLLAYPDEMGYGMFFKRPFENGERRLFTRILAAGSVRTFLDVGANQGIYSLIAARHMPGGRVIAFEPVEDEAAKLERNIRLNRYRNVTVERMAVGATEGEVAMFVALSGMGAYSSLRPPGKDVSAETMTVQVKAITLDTYVVEKRLSSLDLVKVDVEGGERDVLRGAEQVIRSHQPIFMIEVEDRRTMQWGYAAREIIDFLSDRGYRWCDIGSRGELYEHKMRERYSWENLIAIPERALGAFGSLR